MMMIKQGLMINLILQLSIFFLKTDISSSHKNSTSSNSISSGSASSSSSSNTNIPLTDHSVPLFAVKDSHHVNVYIGSPPQRRIVIVDTGSRLLVFPCKPCVQCGTNHVSKTYFDLEYSSTDYRSNDCNSRGSDSCSFSQSKWISQCKNNQCTFHQSYTEGSSMTGYEVEDITWLGTHNVQQSIKQYMPKLAVPMTFGCQSSEKGLIASQYADGIMGLSNAYEYPSDDEVDKADKADKSNKADNNEGGNIIRKMYDSHLIPSHAFSMCLSRYEGILSLGGTSLKLWYPNANDVGKNRHKRKHSEVMKTVPISKNSGYYSIAITDFHIGGLPIPMPTSKYTQSKYTIDKLFNSGKGTIVDSGTSDTYLPKQIATQIKQVWKTFTKNGQGQSQGRGRGHTNQLTQYTFQEFQMLPNITFTLEGNHQWTIQPSELMEPAQRDRVHSNGNKYG
jgi:hypothetical protein